MLQVVEPDTITPGQGQFDSLSEAWSRLQSDKQGILALITKGEDRLDDLKNYLVTIESESARLFELSHKFIFGVKVPIAQFVIKRWIHIVRNLDIASCADNGYLSKGQRNCWSPTNRIEITKLNTKKQEIVDTSKSVGKIPTYNK